MHAGPSSAVPPLDLTKLLKVRSHEIADDDCINNWVEYIDDLIYHLDINLLCTLRDTLAELRSAHEKISSEADRGIWFRRTFSFLHNNLGQLSPRLFVYFQQCELLAFARPIYWYDNLSESDKIRAGDKLMELLDKADTPRRVEFSKLLPYRLMTQAARIQIENMPSFMPTPRAVLYPTKKV